MVGRENVATKRQRDDDKHQHFLVVLAGLEDNELVIEKREAVMVDVITVGRVEGRNIGFRERRRRR